MIFYFEPFRKALIRLWSYEITRLLLVSIAAHTSSISVGLTQGYSAVLLPQLLSSNTTLTISTEESSWIASLGVISTPFGALISGILVDVLGRRLTIAATSLPFLTGWILMAFATDVRFLYIGRAITGFAAGMTNVGFLYIAEVSTKEHRSMLSSLASIAVSLGVLIVYTLGSLVSWQRTALISSSFSVLTALCMLNVPESPSWLVSHGDVDKAEKSLSRLRPDPFNARVELAALVNTKTEADQVKAMSKTGEATKWRLASRIKDQASAILSPTVYKPFLILVFFFIFQEGSGIYIFLFYSNHIFNEFGTDYDENLISVTIAVFRLAMAAVGAVLMSKIGRRPLGVFSGACMSVSLLAVSVYQFLYDHREREYHFLPFVSVLFYVGFSMTGFLQLPWILTSELFPLDHRGLYSGITSSLGYLFLFVTVKIYANLLDLLRLQGLLWGFFVMTCVGTLFVYFFLPETKDRSLKDISASFLGGKYVDEEMAATGEKSRTRL